MLFTYYYRLYGINFNMVMERRADLMVEAEAEKSGNVVPCHNSDSFFFFLVASHLISLSQFFSYKMEIIMVPCS